MNDFDKELLKNGVSKGDKRKMIVSFEHSHYKEYDYERSAK